MAIQTLLQIVLGPPLTALCLAVIAHALREIVHGPDAAKLTRRRHRVN